MYAEIAEIYQYAQLIPAIKEIIRYCYSEEDIHVRSNWEDIRNLIIDFCKLIAKTNSTLAEEIYSHLSQACSYTTNEKSNYILMGDELQDTMPLMYRGIAAIGEVDVVDDQLEMFSTKSGFLSYRNLETQRVYHSTVDPMWEAYELAKRIYDSSYTGFCFLGCGLGYLPWQVFCISDCSADIYIFHNDERMINTALNYGVMEWIPKNKLHIVIEKDEQKLLRMFTTRESVSGRSGQHVLEDIMDLLSNENKQWINQFIAQIHTQTVWGKSLTINAYRNAYHVPAMIHEFRPKTISEEWIVVAAGPSLDDCMEYLKTNVGKKTILCASTVLQKLLQNGVRPDAVAVLDPQARTWGHFDKLEDMSVPLLLNVTANWRFGELYTGPKYLIPSLTDETTVRNYMLQGVEPWFVGSTVSSLMLEIAIHFGARVIEMIGVDLAYPTGRTHAVGTMDEKEIQVSGMRLVPSVTGGTVPTTAQFMIYIEEIEKIISENARVDFLNLSACGAKFAGAEKKNF